MQVELLPGVSTHLTQVANRITERVAELLYAPVYVTNDRGVVVTSSDRQWVGLSFDRVSSIEPDSSYLRVPLRWNAQMSGVMGEVIVGTPLNGETISPRLAQVLVELVISQTTAIDRLPNQHELKNQLIYSLLHGQLADEAAILLQAKQLGMDLTPPRAVILIDAANYVFHTGCQSEKHSLGRFTAGDAVSAKAVLEADQRRRAQLVIGSIVSFFHLPSDTICADLGQGEVAVLKASDTKNLESWADFEGTETGSSSWANLTALRRAADALLLRLRSDTGAAIDVGIGRYHPGLRGLSRSYQDAQAALSLGTRFAGHNRVHCLGRLGVAAFVGVADERTKVDLARYLLSPLDHEPELLTTLDAFFTKDCCPSSTAKRLSIHRNTLSYRFDKIASLTGLDPRRFDDAVQMRLALLLRTLQPQSA